jgi:hypothetical protein
MIKRLIAIVLALAAPAIASATTRYTLDFNVASVHTERWARQSLNQNNLGAGATAHISPDWAFSTGFYRNSDRRTSAYALTQWTPLHIHLGSSGWQVTAGGEGGIVTGYRRSEVLCDPFMAAVLIRVVAPGEWSLNVSAVPNGPNRSSGFLGAQLSVPL